jgi:hypothetical protein
MPQKPTKADLLARVEEVLRVRLDGAEFWDVREYVREKEQEGAPPWAVPEGGKPLSDGTLWRYIGRADRLIAESCRASRKKLLRRHLTQRRALFARALAAGDLRAALAALDSEARLLRLTERPSGRKGKPGDAQDQADGLVRAAAELSGGMDAAAAALTALAESAGDDRLRLAAARAVIDAGLRVKETVELQRRVEELERQAEARKDMQGGRRP